MLFKLILHVKKEAPIVGPISLEYMLEMYFANRLVFPTPLKKEELKEILSVEIKTVFDFTV